MTHIIPLTKIGFFNPGRLSDEEIEQSFIARVPFFEFIFKKIVAGKPNSIPQHHLIIGQRGMGKSSLLVRIAAELRKHPYIESFIPLSFPEEQYNVDRLSKFWLNCMDALADALDKENKNADLASLDAEISNLSKVKNLTAKDAYETFAKWIGNIKRRPVLLVDNLNLIFAKIDKEEQHQLRAILMAKGAPILVGASATAIDETVDYQAPFYDAFQINYLKKLSFEESLDVLLNLAQITGNEDFKNSVYLQKGRLEALYQLTGGTPRTLAILFPLIQNGFSEDIQTDLDALLDIITPLYKARFEELPEQLQVVMDAIALHWDPINLEQLRAVTMLENGQLSPQLKRLIDIGWLQKLDAYKAKGGAYELTERFFNVWYLMRRSSRRQKRELYCLTKFLESFYGDGLNAIAKSRINCKSENINQIALDLALADAIKERELSEKLRNKGYSDLINLGLNDSTILKNFTIPSDITRDELVNLTKKAESLLNNESYVEAENVIKTLLGINPNLGSAWILLGLLNNYHLNDYEQARIAFEKAISLNVKSTLALLHLARLHSLKLNNHKEAEQAYKKALSIDKTLIVAWSELGDLYKDELVSYSKAERAYKNALKLDANSLSSLTGLADLYKNHLERYDLAVVEYKKLVEINPLDSYSWEKLGDLYSDHLFKNEDAEFAYKKAIEADDKNELALISLGILYGETVRYDEAESLYKKAIELNNKNDFAWFCLGVLYTEKLGKYFEAEKALQKAIELDNQIPFSWNSIGTLYTILGKYTEAEDAFKKAIVLDNKNPLSWNNLGNLYLMHLENYAEAESALKKAIELNQNDTNSWNSLGNLYQDFLGKYVEAEKAYKKVLSIDSTNEMSKYNLVFLWRDKLNKFKDAKEMFDSLKKSEELEDSYLLNNALFAYYEKNIGVAEDFIIAALSIIGDLLPSITRDDWYRSAAVIVKLGFGNSLLNALSNTGHDVILRPLYVAIQALTKNEHELFFNSIAAEIREPAKKIMVIMKKYME